MNEPERRRRPWYRRPLVWVVAGVVGLLVLAVAGAPMILGSAAARQRVLAQANAVLAPGGRLTFERMEGGLLGSIRLHGFALGEVGEPPLLKARTMTIERGLLGLALSTPRIGTITFDGASLEIVRRADGSTNLTRALANVLDNPKPRADWTLRFPGVDLTVRSPELRVPLHPERADVTVSRPVAPRPLVCRVNLADGGGELRLVTDYGLWTRLPDRPADLTVNLTSRRWPLDIVTEAVSTRGALDSDLRVERREGLWRSTGTLSAPELRAGGSRLGGESVRLEALKGAWELAQTPARWELKRLDLSGPFGTLKGAPLEGAEPGARIRGELDLAAVARLVPGLDAPRSRVQAGSARVDLTAKAVSPVVVAARGMPVRRVSLAQDPAETPPAAPPAGVQVEGQIDVSGLRLGPGDAVIEVPPVTLGIRAAYRGAGQDAIEIDRLDVVGPGTRMRLAGRIDDLGGTRLARLEGEVVPDWSLLSERLAERLDSEVMIGGEPIQVRFLGPLAPPERGTIWQAAMISARTRILTAQAAGISVDQLVLEAQAENGVLRFTPIEGLVNGGQLYLEPTLLMNDDGSTLLRLEPGSRLVGALLNDDVSHRVLAFVVPVLDQATRVEGIVSAQVQRAELPIAADGSMGPGAVAEGQVVFSGVSFGPGPLARSLIDIASPGREPRLTLDQPVVLDVHDERVYQRGLNVPLGPVSVTMDGSVGFDRTMALDVALPLNAELFTRVPVFNNIAREIKPVIPVRGTLSEPKVDGDAMGKAMGRMGLNIAGEATAGGLDLLLRALEPKTPEEAARRAAEAQVRREEAERQRQERKQRQLERRRQNQMRRNGP